MGDVAKAAGAKWKALTDAQKKPYEEKFAAKMKEYSSAMEKYKASKADAEEDNEEDEEEEEEKPAAKKAKVSDSDVMDEVKKQGYARQYKLLAENPKLAGTPANKILDALNTASGAVVAARKSL